MGRLWRRYSKARGGRDRRLLRVIPADARTRTCSPCCVVVALGGATGTAHPRAGSAGRARPSRSLAHIQATQVARTESTRAPSRPVKSLSGDANRKLRQPSNRGKPERCTRGGKKNGVVVSLIAAKRRRKKAMTAPLPVSLAKLSISTASRQLSEVRHAPALPVLRLVIIYASSAARRLCSSPALRLAGSAARRLCGSPALRLAGSAARRLCGSPALRLAGSAARRLCGSPALRLAGSAARRLCGSPALRLAGSLAVNPRNTHVHRARALPSTGLGLSGPERSLWATAQGTQELPTRSASSGNGIAKARQSHEGPHLELSRRAIHQLGCRTEIFSWFVRSTADKREMQKYSARKREMQKYSAHNRKIQKYSAHKAKNAAHTRKMQQMRLENSRSKSEPDVGSSAGVGLVLSFRERNRR